VVAADVAKGDADWCPSGDLRTNGFQDVVGHTAERPVHRLLGIDDIRAAFKGRLRFGGVPHADEKTHVG
jgi:hypothetical protein